MSAVAALAAGLLLASPLARALPSSSPSTALNMNIPGPPPHPLRNRLERRTFVSRWRRGLA